MDAFRQNRDFKQSNIALKQAVDGGMAFVLCSLIVYLIWKPPIALRVALVALIINMIYPLFFRPFAKIWFGLASIIGNVVSKIFLALIFYLIVAPTGLFRKIIGKDSLKLKFFKRGADSLFTDRNHEYDSTDLKEPF